MATISTSEAAQGGGLLPGACTNQQWSHIASSSLGLGLASDLRADSGRSNEHFRGRSSFCHSGRQAMQNLTDLRTVPTSEHKHGPPPPKPSKRALPAMPSLPNLRHAPPALELQEQAARPRGGCLQEQRQSSAHPGAARPSAEVHVQRAQPPAARAPRPEEPAANAGREMPEALLQRVAPSEGLDHRQASAPASSRACPRGQTSEEATLQGVARGQLEHGEAPALPFERKPPCEEATANATPAQNHGVLAKPEIAAPAVVSRCGR
mmetsp:Transcript_130897/g.418954  ORF Transcript_130897/g.418954 Transcript_130897/m.418954 type:complete len:265 (+) Transcript_130897:1697-2491(+)